MASFIAFWGGATGRIDHASVGDTRTAADLATYFSTLVALSPNAAKIPLLMDCLNIHP